jgi:hypothetical protein
MSNRTVQHFFSEASKALDLHIYSRIFRHTAATQLNKIAGLDVTKYVLGHKNSAKCSALHFFVLRDTYKIVIYIIELSEYIILTAQFNFYLVFSFIYKFLKFWNYIFTNNFRKSF